MIPQSYEEWKNCIENDCGIPLTKDFIEKRLSVFENRSNPETKKFIQLYGSQYLDNIIYWYKRSL